MNLYEKYLQEYKNFFKDDISFVETTSKKVISFKQAQLEFSGVNFIIYLSRYIASYLELSKKPSITILDYGCGRGQMPWMTANDYKNGLWGRFKDNIQAIWLYDPANPSFEKKPPIEIKFDVVGCAEVLEHIPEEFIDDVLKTLDSYTADDGIILITTGNFLAKKEFSNGENVHITCKPREWWLKKLFDATNKQFILEFYENKKLYIIPGNMNSEQKLQYKQSRV